MAINWTTAQAAKAIKEGNKEAISDIGRRFPLFLAAVASNDIDTILAAIPEHITARKIEAVLKYGVQESDAEDTDSDVEDEKPVKKENKKPAKKATKKNEDADEDETEDDPVALYKECKKAGLKVKSKQTADYYKKQLATLEENEEDDDWGDEEEDEAPKKPVKKADKKPVKKAPKKEEPEDDEEDDDDDWDI